MFREVFIHSNFEHYIESIIVYMQYSINAVGRTLEHCNPTSELSESPQQNHTSEGNKVQK